MGAFAGLAISIVGKIIAGLLASIGIKRAAEQTGRLKERLETTEKTREAEQIVAREVATERTDGEVIDGLDKGTF